MVFTRLILLNSQAIQDRKLLLYPLPLKMIKSNHSSLIIGNLMLRLMLLLKETTLILRMLLKLNTQLQPPKPLLLMRNQQKSWNLSMGCTISTAQVQVIQDRI